MRMVRRRRFGRQSAALTGGVWVHLAVLLACLFSLGSGSSHAQEKKADSRNLNTES